MVTEHSLNMTQTHVVYFSCNSVMQFCLKPFLQIDVLPEVVKAVRNTGVEVYVDGGVRMGTDALKALALGARAVFVGRPIIWGLSHDVSVFFND